MSTEQRALDHFYPTPAGVIATYAPLSPQRVAVSLAALISILESRGVLTGEDVTRILTDETKPTIE